jgi:hypothetical protein
MIDSKGCGSASRGEGVHDHVDLDTVATALYVRIDDEMKASPQLNRYRPKVGESSADH